MMHYDDAYNYRLIYNAVCIVILHLGLIWTSMFYSKATSRAKDLITIMIIYQSESTTKIALAFLVKKSRYH